MSPVPTVLWEATTLLRLGCSLPSCADLQPFFSKWVSSNKIHHSSLLGKTGPQRFSLVLNPHFDLPLCFWTGSQLSSMEYINHGCSIHPPQGGLQVMLGHLWTRLLRQVYECYLNELFWWVGKELLKRTVWLVPLDHMQSDCSLRWGDDLTVSLVVPGGSRSPVLGNVREIVFANLMSITWYLMVGLVCIAVP